MAKLTQAVSDSIAKKDLTIRAIGVETTQPAAVARQMGDDPRLAQVKELLAKNRVRDAIEKARPLAQEDAKYNAALLDALCFSTREEDWQEAEELLKTYGECRHYRRLAFDYWSKGHTAEAIALAEDGLTIALNTPSDWLELARSQNSLAYYYAEAEVHEKAPEATRLIGAAIKAIKGKDAQLEASFLATRGFVRIVFGKTEAEVMSGLHDCERGRYTGARRDLYFHHSKRAHARLISMNAMHGTTSHQDQKPDEKKKKK